MSRKPRKDVLLAIPAASRPGWLAVEKGRLDVGGHCLALVRETDEVEIPPAAFAALLLEPGVSVTHEAVKLCAENSTALLWVGEAGTRLYAASVPHANPERQIRQALIHSGDPRSFVYDLADTVKFSVLAPAVFQRHANGGAGDFSSVRLFCRDLFREQNLLDRLLQNADRIILDPPCLS